MVRTVQDHVRLPRLHGRLPDIIAVIVFQLPQGLHRGIIQHPDRLLPVRGLHGFHRGVQGGDDAESVG